MSHLLESMRLGKPTQSWAEVRKAQIINEIAEYAGAFGAEHYAELMLWSAQRVAEDQEREQHEAPAPIEQWGRGND